MTNSMSRPFSSHAGLFLPCRTWKLSVRGLLLISFMPARVSASNHQHACLHKEHASSADISPPWYDTLILRLQAYV